MAIRSVLKMGDPLLLQVAKPVEQFNTPDLHGLIADMIDTMKANKATELFNSMAPTDDNTE